MARFGVWLASALLSPGAARADDTHYQDYLVGGRAIGMGGAFTSISDDPSGLYYNPAGIADVHRSNVQVSTSLYGFENGSVARAAYNPLSLNFTSLIAIPASAGFVAAFGSRGVDGLPKQTFGLTVIVPSYRSYSAGSNNGQRTYLRRVTDSELWAGAGYARHLGNGWRLGAAAYYIIRSLSDREQVTSYSPGNGVLGAQFESINDDFELTVGNLVMLLGAKYQMSQAWSFGAMVQLPSLQLNSQGTLSYERAAAQPSPNPQDQAEFLSQTYPGSAHMGYAPSFRLGASYKRPYRFTAAADVSGHLPIHYNLLDMAKAPTNDTLFNPAVRRDAVFNFNIGGEYLIIREVSLQAGLFSDFSSAPDIPEFPTGEYQPKVDMLGLSMALSYIGDYTLSRVGMVYSFGEGHDVVPSVNSGNAGQSFARVNYFQSFFYVFLSSSFRY